jgi:predicted nucleotidyltransferase
LRKGGGDKVDNPLKKALAEAIALLESAGYRYAVIGGIANQVWGEPRFTYDVDIKVLVPNTDYAAARTTIRTTFSERGRPGLSENPLIVDVKIGEIIVDFLLTVPGYEERIVTRAVRRNVGDLLLWICSPEDLVIQKAVAGRAKDWQDIEGILIEQHGRLDQNYLQDWLTQFAEVLEQPNILEQYQMLQARIVAAQKDDPD